MKRYKNKYRSDTTRFQYWDYGAPGFYFVTINTKNREHYFGEIAGEQNFASLEATPIGKIAQQYWTEIPNHFPFVVLDEFVVMPDHIHGILSFHKPGYPCWIPNSYGPQSENLASVIRGFKAGVKAFATTNQVPFAWQSRYHDRIIRTEKELEIIRKYIRNNPMKWVKDKVKQPSSKEVDVRTQNFASPHFVSLHPPHGTLTVNEQR